MSSFSGKEMLFLLDTDSSEGYYKLSGFSNLPFYKFIRDIWKNNSTSQWYYKGVLDGAITLRKYQRLEDDVAQFQCMQHHLCVGRELGLY